ncbi:hypothetical protein GCM10029976_055590 [Kribbella albertanoniae]|uniref:Uncharacterized protein n=1 Tax=Kribbella albertanoniae TaxID=1266829 RepID=A0A4R4PIM5_9ACTN|nr:hypothetical protein [Kribbella albertanoniae]TDC21719.1 hypothetical protein E1261_32685 [Kribbella albertanoniae]
MKARVVGPIVLGLWVAWIAVPILLSFLDDWSVFRIVMLLFAPWSAVPSHWRQRVPLGRALQIFGILLLLLLPLGGILGQVPIVAYVKLVAPVAALPLVWLSNRRWTADLGLQRAAS